MKIQINRSKIIFVIYMIFVLNVTHSIFYSNSARALQIPLAMLGLFYMFVADKGVGKIRVKSINEFNAFCTPMIVITMISVYTSIAV